jgi:hypothetical protein
LKSLSLESAVNSGMLCFDSSLCPMVQQ